MIAIVDVPDPDTHMVLAEESLLVPVPGQTANTIALEGRDGSNVLTYAANAFVYTENKRRAARAQKLAMSIFVTDARIAFACTRYDKGGGYWGVGAGAVLAVGLNAASKAATAYKRRGKMLVGQVRYPALAAVGSGYSGGFRAKQYLTVRSKPNRDHAHEVEFVLNGAVDAAELAAEVARRAARYSLAVSPDLTQDQRANIQTMLQAQPIRPPTAKRIHFQLMPTYHFENPKTARYGLDSSEFADA